jgi:hypothetical protein
MKNIIKIMIIGLVGIFALTSCLKDLDTFPLDTDVNSPETQYKTADGYLQVLAKLYAGLAVTGQQGPAGDGDIQGIDEGFSSYLRQYWNLQELPTDEAINGWNDDGIPNLNFMSWSSTNPFNRALYYRIYYQITLANEFIRESSDSKLDDRGFSDADKVKIREYRAEARFLRALSYWHALDLYTDTPFITEDDPIGAFLPNPITRTNLFNYIEGELLALEDLIKVARTNQYGRADQGAVWTLLAKLYLNAEVYTGQPKYTECITYCTNVKNAGYSLTPVYGHLFLADNHRSVVANEAIFSVVFDGLVTQTYGGTTFLVHAAVGGNMSIADYGIDYAWGGNRTTKTFVNLFTDITGNTDSRAMFHTSGQTLEITDINDFTTGYAIKKFRNVTSAGLPGSHQTFVDNDFHLFRLPDVYLMYAEAVLRGGTGGDQATALGYINEIRERAYGDNSGNISVGEMTLNFILDERARELYWEGHRRTDLIRFGKFTSNTMVWPWKGGVSNGIGVEDKYNVFPIPASDVVANPNLSPTPGY